MRLIDADALKDKCYITINGTTIGRNNYVMFHEIDDAPTIDAVEIVRCKDCKYQEHCHETVAHTKHCNNFIEHWSESIEWCSRGERKGGEDE